MALGVRIRDNAFRKKRAGDQEFYSLEYRVREGSQWCLLDVVEVIGVGDWFQGVTQGFRARHQACDWELPGRLGRDRKQAQDRFRIVTRPATYYTQFLKTDEGITIKATGKVDPVALRAAANIVSVMLDGREDIPGYLADAGEGMAIIPKDELVNTLPEFVGVKGSIAWEGTPFEHKFEDSRGLGAVRGQPVSAVGEERILKFPENGGVSPGTAIMTRTTIHEFAHAIENLCFAQQDNEKWDESFAKPYRPTPSLGRMP